MLGLLANELFLTVACGALLAVSLTTPGMGVLRVAAGLAGALFVPGYALVGAAVPHRDEIDDVSRIALAFGLSVVSDAILAWALSLAPVGITLKSVGYALAGWSLVFALVANVRRVLTRRNARLESMTPVRGRTVLVTAGGLALVVGLVAVAAWAHTAPAFTEFYLLGPGGSLEGLPQEVTSGRTVQVTVGVVNREHATQTYWYEIRHQSQQLAHGQEITLRPLEKNERILTFRLEALPEDDDVTLELYLYRADDERPTRSLRWPVRVVSADN
jgi:uncharacterized membrane protein